MGKLGKSAILSIVVSGLLSSVNATTLKEAVESTINNNPEVRAIMLNKEAFRYYVDEAQGAYYPSVEIEVTGESRKTEEEYLNNAETKTYQDGYNAQIRLEQLIYDGGYTPARVDETKFQDKINSFEKSQELDELIFDGVKSYLNVVKHKKREILAEHNIRTHEKYYEIAKEHEELSGNAVETFEVKSKLHQTKKNYLMEQDSLQQSKKSLKRIMGKELEGNICMPQMNQSKIADEFKVLLDYTLSNNNTILAELSKVHRKEAELRKEDSKFLPTIRLEFSAEHDDDLIAADTKKDIYSSQIILTYNLINGGSDIAAKTRAKKFLNESQETIDNETNKLTEEIGALYDSFNMSKKIIAELKEYVSSTEEVLKFYKYEFDGGTRKFIDVLDQETDLYFARLQLINEEARFAELYYNILVYTAQIKNVMLESQPQVCAKELISFKDTSPKQDDLKDISELLNE